MQLIEVVVNRFPRALGTPNVVFLKDSCYWPKEIGLAEKFNPKWVLLNNGETGNAFLGVSYKGKDYAILVNGGYSFPLEAGHGTNITGTDFTIQEFFKNVEQFTETQTIEIIFITGYATGTGENFQYYVTDNWDCPTYVKVSGGLPVPTWMLAAGALLGVVLVSGVALTRKKRK